MSVGDMALEINLLFILIIIVIINIIQGCDVRRTRIRVNARFELIFF